MMRCPICRGPGQIVIGAEDGDGIKKTRNPVIAACGGFIQPGTTDRLTLQRGVPSARGLNALPASQVAAFAGTWATRTDKNWSYTVTLAVTGNTVDGTYLAQDGSRGHIRGSVSGNVLRFGWEQDGGFRGTGQFTLAPGGNSFTGSYDSEPHPQLQDLRYRTGLWNGARSQQTSRPGGGPSVGR